MMIIPTLPTSPKAVMTDAEIDAQIDDRLPYRKGWPILPVLPCTNDHEDDEYIDYCDVYTSVAAICRELGILIPERGMDCRQRCSFGVSESWSTLTLQIRLDISTNSRWVEAIRRIKRYFIETDIDIAMIGLIDKRMVQLSNFRYGFPPCDERYTGSMQSRDTRYIQLWQAKKHFVVRCLGDVQWASIDFVFRGFCTRWGSEGVRPTVVITSPTANDLYWWDVVLPSIRLLCPEFDVELLQGSPKGLKILEQSAESVKRLHIPTKGKVFFGDSVGSKGSPRSGTLGAVIKLSKYGVETGSFALTAYSAVSSKTLDKACRKRGALGPDDPLLQETEQIICSPSHADLKVLEHEIGRQHEYCTRQVDRLESDILEAKKRGDEIAVEAVQRKEEFEKSERQRKEEGRQGNKEKELGRGDITLEQASRSIRSKHKDLSGDRMNLHAMETSIKSLEDSHRMHMANLIIDRGIHAIDLVRCEERKKKLEDRDYGIGKLYACSGPGRAMSADSGIYPHLVDWALVALPKPLIRIGPHCARRRAYQTGGHMDQNDADDMEDGYLRKWSRLDKSVLDSNVARCTHRGQETPFWAVGKLNAVDSLVNASLIYGAELNIPGKAMSVRMMEGDKLATNEGPGALVMIIDDPWQTRTRWLGLYLGYNRATRMSYMMPMEPILHDIEEVTGATVTSPQR